MVMHAEGSVRVRAIRGATTVERDDPTLIAEAVREMLAVMVAENGFATDDIVSAMFTMTPDLRSVFPASAARSMGWHDVPLMCASEIDVEGAQPRCIRVMLHVERAATSPPVTHAYLREAAALRPDLSQGTRETQAGEREMLAAAGAEV